MLSTPSHAPHVSGRLSGLCCLAALLFSLMPKPAAAANFFQGVSPASVPWPGGIIPYTFDTNDYNITPQEQSVILAGLREWELAANVKFIPYTNQANHVILQFTNDGSGTGYCLLGNPATLMLHGLARGLICHEGGHLLGFQHEHQRIDRDSYIVVNPANLLGGTNGEAEFNIDSNSIAYGPYDLVSVMHYGVDTFTNGAGDALDPLPAYEKFYHKLGNLALSIGDRAAAAHLYGAPSTPLTSLVTNTADGGPGSLRAAIYYANDHPGTTIQFNLPTSDPGYHNGIFTISLIGELPPLTSPGTIIDGTSQPGYTGTPVVALDGSQVSGEAGNVSGLHLYGTNSTVLALALDNFNYSGIQLFCSDAVSNHVEGCYIGLEPDGVTAGPDNLAGILFEFGATNNFIGNTNATARNLISGNLYYGVLINDTNSDGNVIRGNYIGLNAAGSAAVANGYSGVGIYYEPCNTIIGGTNAGARNVISGNMSHGIYLAGTNSSGTVIQGNYIGTDATGTQPVANGIEGIGVYEGAHNATIGGAQTGAGNLIAGNTDSGVALAGPAVTNNLIQGNLVGVNAADAAALPNGQHGILIYGGSSDNLIGGSGTGAANVLSGNALEGIYISDSGTSNNIVQGNFIGTDLTGKVALGNGDTGAGVWNGATGNVVVGNVLSANDDVGVAMGGSFGTLVQSNFIGTDITGKTALGNAFAGVGVWGGATNNLVGGTNAGSANVISGNSQQGVYLSDAGTSGNFVEGNFIGTDITGKTALANGFCGVGFQHGATANTIGGTNAGSGNIISGNESEGVYLTDPGTAYNVIEGNLIGVDITGKTALPNSFCGVGAWAGAGPNIVGGTVAAAANVISGNGDYGVALGGPSSFGTAVLGNEIGTDATGTNALGNVFAGVGIYGGSSVNSIGGSVPGSRNVISANGTYGIYISDTNSLNNTITGNYIGTDATGTNALGNGSGGVELQAGASGNQIGGFLNSQINVIAFNGGPGVLMLNTNTTNNPLTINIIYGNHGLGIDLNNDGVTPNHAGFLAGPNNLQNYPVITGATGKGSTTVVSGTLNSLPNQTYLVDFYCNPAADPSGHGQGRLFAGNVNVTTDGSGNGTFGWTNATVNYSGQYLTAIATSPVGDTSEFSTDVLITNSAPPAVAFSSNPPPAWVPGGFAFTLSLVPNNNYRIQATTNLAAQPVVWTDLTNLAPATSTLTFTDHAALNQPMQFYRVVSP